MKLEIDYASHPAFTGISSSRGCLEAERYFVELDDLWGELVAPASALSAEQAAAEFDRRSVPLLSGLKQVLFATPIQQDYLPFVFKSLDNSLLAIRTEIMQVIDGRVFQAAGSKQVGAICEQLR